MLEYFGQSPIIVRSSSLQEDSFGNAFAGKYESVFCPNQGTPEDRLENFENAVRRVYASTMNMDALHYRQNRGLAWKDEQMAILIQRVSGDYYGDYFFPHTAGVGNSSNLYVYEPGIDMDAGMLRLVFGLGTRAVDRVIGDYVKIVTLDDPMRRPLMSSEEEIRYSQHKADVLNLSRNCLETIDLEDAVKLDMKTDLRLFGEKDPETARRLREMGRDDSKAPFVLNFRRMLSGTRFPEVMQKAMSVLSEKYRYPVDIEFTANFQRDGSFKFNLLQCRPLQTRGLGKTVALPETVDPDQCLFCSRGNFMGGNVRLPIRYVVLVKTLPYLNLPDREKIYSGSQNRHTERTLERKAGDADRTRPLGNHHAFPGSSGQFYRTVQYDGDVRIVLQGERGGARTFLWQSFLPGYSGNRDLLCSSFQGAGRRSLP